RLRRRWTGVVMRGNGRHASLQLTPPPRDAALNCAHGIQRHDPLARAAPFRLTPAKGRNVQSHMGAVRPKRWIRTPSGPGWAGDEPERLRACRYGPSARAYHRGKPPSRPPLHAAERPPPRATAAAPSVD